MGRACLVWCLVVVCCWQAYVVGLVLLVLIWFDFWICFDFVWLAYTVVC